MHRTVVAVGTRTANLISRVFPTRPKLALALGVMISAEGVALAAITYTNHKGKYEWWNCTNRIVTTPYATITYGEYTREADSCVPLATGETVRHCVLYSDGYRSKGTGPVCSPGSQPDKIDSTSPWVARAQEVFPGP